MNKKKKIAVLITIFIISLLMPTNIFASERREADKIDIQEVYEFFIKEGVEESKAVELIERINNGEILDSMNPDFVGNISIIGFENGQKYIYPDGSIKITTIEIPSPQELPVLFSASGGTWHSGSTWWEWMGVDIKQTTGGTSISFKMDCNGNAYGYSSITKVYDGKVSSFFSAEYTSPKINQSKQTASSPAIASLTCDITFINLSKARAILQGCVEGSSVYSRLR